MEKYITDERTGLKYELVGDYYLIAGDDEPEKEQKPIGIWGAAAFAVFENTPQDCLCQSAHKRETQFLSCRHRRAGTGNALSAGRADETDTGYHGAAKG